MGDNQNKEKSAPASSPGEEGGGKANKQWENDKNGENSGGVKKGENSGGVKKGENSGGSKNLSNSDSSRKGKGKKGKKRGASDSIGKRQEQQEAKASIEGIFNNLKAKEKKATKVGSETRSIKKGSEKSGLNAGRVQKKAQRRVGKETPAERARTPDGLPIYSMEELKMGQGGYTKDCPFECSCCF
ncbi:hypothetical protein PVBG_02280 [Plasmodium vivax Brazil I]|uniref:DUF1764 domain-containing protein n=1 Tax=Plasmodium vivax (strain Brazil I) TaxID=1033975 RepID=A0A0J9VCV4_PLAV1|nr:hypothetical protein PVBG_02280 [Plasmodium vivax Brazil I]